MQPETTRCDGFSFRSFRWAQTMRFAVEEINQKHQILPNISLGFRIDDSCNTQFQALRAAIILLTGESGRWTTSIPAIIGASGVILAGALLGVFNIPLVSYFSTCPCLSNKQEYPSFLRTIPSDLFQVNALVELVTYFKWTWIGAIATDDEYGQYGIQLFNKKAANLGSCIAFTTYIPKVPTQNKIAEIVDMIRHSRVKVVLAFAVEQDVEVLMQEITQHNVTGIQWLASEAWVTSALLSTKEQAGFLDGTVGFGIKRANIPGLKEFLLQLHPSNVKENPFVTEFWEEIFNCSLDMEFSDTGTSKKPCSGHENLTSSSNIYSDVSQLRISYHVYKAVYAIAHALHDLLAIKDDISLFVNGSCPRTLTVKPWQLLHYLKNVKFDSLGEEVHFDENGDPLPSYDLINWQKKSDVSIDFINVGYFAGTDTGLPKLDIDKKTILWNGGKREVPKSACSESCSLGSRKGLRRGEPICCFDCVPCADGEISNQTDSSECITCPLDYWSNLLQDRCILREIDYLSFEDVMGILLIAASLLGACVTCAVLIVFAYYRDTPIVKGNNSELSFLILVSLVLCFLCSLTFIGEPSQWSCMLRNTIFGITFALCFSCILAKTSVVLMAFKATLPGSKAIKWFKPAQQRALIFFGTAIQITVCIAWLFIAPPFPNQNTQVQTSKIILECAVGSLTFFSFVLGYIGFLSCFSFVFAFLAHELPSNYNEAKHITFSMVIFLTVWIAFIPAYISTHGKYTIAVQIFAILTSTFGLLICIFAPKVYVILLKPEENTKKRLLNRVVSE
ncbi:extracellular calcium-sensing receptor-like [Protopterus annectens]|uniref:extracellular calcium-sensing receptor-like n=1 Tax=Protopterus annectens TaxID=7888 RepID=UPI001CFB4E47|nr:extracellular calcium-sensing receptor-like [Protopterus annectens]